MHAEGARAPDVALPWYAFPLLPFPRRIARGLARVRDSGRFEKVPNRWQLALGVLRMWHRLVYKPETIGVSDPASVRPTLRARLLSNRKLRFPFLLAERAVAPLDMTGLASSRERTLRHLLGAYHDRQQFAYDLELLACNPGALEELHRRVSEVVAHDTPRSRWLRDLTVFDRYHERLLEAVEAALEGRLQLDAGEANDPYISFGAYIAWCAAQPESPQATLHAWLAGRFDFEHGLTAEGAA